MLTFSDCRRTKTPKIGGGPEENGQRTIEHRMEEDTMEKEQREKLKAHILEKMESLKADIAAYKEVTKPVSPDNAIGRLTRMEAISSKSINDAALKKAKDTMARLTRALDNIDTPDFGLCIECEEPIPFARLMVMPEASLCVRCAEHLGG